MATCRACDRESSAAHYEDNPHAWWESSYRTRAKRFGFEPTVKSFTKPELIEAYGDECYWCGDGWTELDHVVAVVEGGEHTLENCVPSCRSCNRRRNQVSWREAEAREAEGSEAA